MRTIHIAMIGLGTVGSGVAKLLTEQASHLESQCGARLLLRRVVVRDLDKPRAVTLPETTEVTDDLERVLDDPSIEIAIELMGTVKPAFEIVSRLLEAGKHVVTANKAVLAEHGRELFALAHRYERTICFEASVAGGVPIIAALSQSLGANRIGSVSGILNGTSNYILTAMHDQGMSYEAALRRARELGFAEADPTLDVDGTDAAQKLAILARLAFQSWVDAKAIRRQGIDGLAKSDIRFASELGYTIKLLAMARAVEGVLQLRVAPALVHKTHYLGQVPAEYNAIQVTGDAVGETFFSGRGAGMLPTASSVVAGLLDLAIGRGQATFRSLRLWDPQPPGPRFEPHAFLQSRFYLRYTITDRPGTLAQIAGILGHHGVSIASVMQHETGEDSIGAAVPLIIMTHVAEEGAVLRALRETDALTVVKEPTVCLHVAD